MYARFVTGGANQGHVEGIVTARATCLKMSGIPLLTLCRRDVLLHVIIPTRIVSVYSRVGNLFWQTVAAY